MNGMNGVAVLIVGIVILVVAYLTYGRWLAKQWGIDPTRKTPAYEQNDGVDYVPAKAPVLDITSRPSPVQVRSTGRSRRRYSAGCRCCCGC